MEWEKLVLLNSSERKIERDKAEEDKKSKKKNKEAEEPEEQKKTNKLSIQHIQSREVVSPGVDFYGVIDELKPLTLLEKGLLLRGIENILTRRIGANGNVGHGRVEYFIQTESDSSIQTVVDKAFTSNIQKVINYSSDDLEALAAFDEWLEQLSDENIKMFEVFEAAS